MNGAYSEEDLSLLRAAANQTAMGLVNARLFANVVSQRTRLEQLLERVIKAQEEERKRLSLELHDAPVQWLTSAVYRVEACIEYFNRGQEPRARKELLEIQHVPILRSTRPCPPAPARRNTWAPR